MARISFYQISQIKLNYKSICSDVFNSIAWVFNIINDTCWEKSYRFNSKEKDVRKKNCKNQATLWKLITSFELCLDDSFFFVKICKKSKQEPDSQLYDMNHKVLNPFDEAIIGYWKLLRYSLIFFFSFHPTGRFLCYFLVFVQKYFNFLATWHPNMKLVSFTFLIHDQRHSNAKLCKWLRLIRH